MVRLVFRPYTQVGRPICTSGPLRASTRVSSGFALPRHSSPSFGSYRTRSCSTSPTERARRAGGAPGAPEGQDPTSDDGSGGLPTSPLTPGALCTWAGPRPGDATQLGRTEDSPPRSTVAPGSRGPVPARRRRGRSGHSSHGPGKRRSPGEGALAGRGAPPRRKCARRGPAARGRGSPRGSPDTARPSLTSRVESPGQTARTPPVYLLTVSRPLELSLQSSFQLSLRYLSTIGLVPVFSLRWSLPPALGCIPKQPDSEKTGPRRDEGRYRPHTVHGLSLYQKDSGPRSTPGKRSSVRHISRARLSDGDSALGSSLFARRY
ncbi:hypothetical protein WMY93_028709 [Mugilogobius chulae]|uniref:Uncharacterized protein n=1 Tax=Mugilogobius chulae TaxID=88201 RepID=A0AAW0MSK6_9GOBI